MVDKSSIPLAVVPTGGGAAAAAGKKSRSRPADSSGAGASSDSLASKLRKAQRYRDLTCPRVRTSTLADGTRIVTVGSHVLVYPAPSANNGAAEGEGAGGEAPPPAPVEGAKHVSRISSSAAAAGARTTFEPHPIWNFTAFPDEAFKHYSLGVGLYFKGVRLLAIVFAMCATIMLPALILCLLANPSTQTDSGLLFERATVGNLASAVSANSTAASVAAEGELPSQLSRAEMVLVISCLDTCACLLLLAFCHWLRRRQESEARAYSRREITVRKYSVEVAGSSLPDHFSDRYALATWFQARFGPVVDVAIAFDQHDLLELYRRRGILRKEIDLAVSHGETGRLDSLYQTLATLDDRIAALQEKMPSRRTLCAYVTFETQESRIACERALGSWGARYLSSLRSASAPSGESDDPARPHTALSPQDPARSLLFGQQRRPLLVRQAPEPSNILFRNLSYSHRNKFARRTLTALITLALLLLSVVAVYFAQRVSRDGFVRQTDCDGVVVSLSAARVEGGVARDCFCRSLGSSAALDAKGDYGVDCSGWLATYALARSLSVLSVLTIVVVNLLLKALVRALVAFERHRSRTRMQESITKKLSIGLFLNTALVLLIVNAQLRGSNINLGLELLLDGRYADFSFEWFVQVGAPITLTLLLNVFNPHALPLIKVPWAAYRRSHCLPPASASQSVWNNRFAGDEFELAERYAVMLNTMFTTLVYSGGMPLLWLIGALTFALTYVFDRVSFFRLYRIPARYDHTLAHYLTTLMPWAVLLHLAFAAWFLSMPALVATAANQSALPTISDVTFSDLVDRLGNWYLAPTLVLLVLVATYLLLFRVGRWLLSLCRNDEDDELVSSDARRFVPYSVAARTVTLETYHPSGSPYYHDAFLRTPSRKMLRKPTPLALLAAEEARQVMERQQAAVERQAYDGPGAVRYGWTVDSTPPSKHHTVIDIEAAKANAATDDKSAAVVAISSAARSAHKAAHLPPVSSPVAAATKDEEEDASESKATLAGRSQPEIARAISMGIRVQKDMRSTRKSIVAATQAAKQAAERNSRAKRSEGRGAEQKTSSSPPAAPSSTAAAPASPSHRLNRLSSDQAVSVVVLDLPNDEAERAQAEVEATLQSPTEALADFVSSSASDAPRFDAHKQHRPHVSLPAVNARMSGGRLPPVSSLSVPGSLPADRSPPVAGGHPPPVDPLLEHVASRLHHLASALSSDTSSAQGESGAVGELSSRILSKKSRNEKKRSKKKGKSSAVHDSSSLALSTAPSASEAAFVDPARPIEASSLSHESSSTASGEGEQLDEQAQLVPVACPNAECAHTIELLDTGAPQLYNCPFCNTAFIM